MTKTIQVSVVTLITSLALTMADAGAEDVYQANITGTGRVQTYKTVKVNCVKDPDTGELDCDYIDVHTITGLSINNKTLINLALGNSIKSNVPPSVVLALAVNGDSSATVGVFDKITSTFVTNILEVVASDVITSGKVVCKGAGDERVCDAVDTAFEGDVELSFLAAGRPESNSIDGGNVSGYVKGNYNTNGVPSKITVSGTGYMDLTLTRRVKDTETGELVDETDSLHVLMSKFTLTTGKRLTSF